MANLRTDGSTVVNQEMITTAIDNLEDEQLQVNHFFMTKTTCSGLYFNS